MKVCHIFKTYFPETQGGVEEVIRQICIQTSKKGYINRVITVAPNPISKYIQFDECEVIRYKTTLEYASLPISFDLIRRFKKETEDVDLFHFHCPWPFVEAFYLFNLIHKKSLVTFHAEISKNNRLKKYYTPLLNYFLKKVDQIVVTSPRIITSCQDLQNHRKTCQVIPLALEEETYPKIQENKLIYWKTNIKNEFYLFIGVLRYYKGLHILIESMKDLPNIQLVIAGTGPMEIKLKKQAEHIKNITFLGFVSDEDKVVLLTICKGVILPSHRKEEAFGICLLEASMYGKPMISTELQTGTSYVNKHEYTGYVVPPNNIIALRNAIQKMNKNEESAKIMGINSRKRFNELFTAKQMGKKYINIYQSLLR